MVYEAANKQNWCSQSQNFDCISSMSWCCTACKTMTLYLPPDIMVMIKCKIMGCQIVRFRLWCHLYGYWKVLQECASNTFLVNVVQILINLLAAWISEVMNMGFVLKWHFNFNHAYSAVKSAVSVHTWCENWEIW